MMMMMTMILLEGNRNLGDVAWLKGVNLESASCVSLVTVSYPRSLRFLLLNPLSALWLLQGEKLCSIIPIFNDILCHFRPAAVEPAITD